LRTIIVRLQIAFSISFHAYRKPLEIVTEYGKLKRKTERIVKSRRRKKRRKRAESTVAEYRQGVELP
jgi:hypothetical protein